MGDAQHWLERLRQERTNSKSRNWFHNAAVYFTWLKPFGDFLVRARKLCWKCPTVTSLSPQGERLVPESLSALLRLSVSVPIGEALAFGEGSITGPQPRAVGVLREGKPYGPMLAT